MVDAYLSVLNAEFPKAFGANFQTHGLRGIFSNKSDIFEAENT